EGLHVAYRQQPDSYFALPSIEASAEWGSLLHGALVGDLTIRRPIIRLHLPLPPKKPPTEKPTLARIKEDLSALRGEPSFWLRPIQVYDGTVELLTRQDYRLALEGLALRLENLSNRQLDDPLRLTVESRVAPAGSFLARATAT